MLTFYVLTSTVLHKALSLTLQYFMHLGDGSMKMIYSVYTYATLHVGLQRHSFWTSTGKSSWISNTQETEMTAVPLLLSHWLGTVKDCGIAV